MRILVTGASGFVGSMLIPKLLGEGHELRGFTRDPSRAREATGSLELFEGNTLTGEGLERALDGVEVAYYLIHSMERPFEGNTSNSSGLVTPMTLSGRERRSAENFAEAVRQAGVERIVYLGGLLPQTDKASPHLESRGEVERILLEAVPHSVALRSSIVIGAKSRSFRFMVRLVERLPILALPAWRKHRTQPIDGRDMTQLLVASASSQNVAGRSLDIAGPDVLTYEAILTNIAEIMLVGRPAFKLSVSLTPIAARLAALIAAEDPELILPLMQGLETDLLPRDEQAATLLGVELHTFDAAVEHALGEWERAEPLSAR